MVKELMMEAGFTKSEADVYLCLLENGPLKASEIANKTGLYRPYVYDNLDNLMQKGLCSSIMMEGKKHFKAARPFTIREYFSEKMQRIDELIPLLDHMVQKTGSEVLVEVYKGRNAIRKAFLDILKVLKEDNKIVHLGMGIEEEAFLGAEPVFGRWFIRQLEKNNIQERMISYEGERVFAGGKTTQYRFIPDKYFNPTQTLIDGDLVTILLFESDPKIAIKIKNPKLADAYRKTFELMWNYGRRRKWRQTPNGKLKLRST
jgi:sugar-specific transcriptional regulator TrmB